ncbi:MAG: hypothetical protein Q4P13_11250 [Psychrobacter sp.]|nr:hypothetical protein [Psychrobacter sp.]
MSLRKENTQVVVGQRLSNRITTMRSLASIPAFAFRKQVLPLKDKSTDRQRDTYAGVGVIGQADEHAIDYVPLGHVLIRVIDMLGGAFHEGGTLIVPEEVSSMALIEPYLMELEDDERITNMPLWQPKKGDLFCFLLNGYKEYHECVGINGNSMLAEHGKRYLLNKRFDLKYLNVLDESKIDDVATPYK